MSGGKDLKASEFQTNINTGTIFQRPRVNGPTLNILLKPWNFDFSAKPLALLYFSESGSGMSTGHTPALTEQALQNTLKSIDGCDTQLQGHWPKIKALLNTARLHQQKKPTRPSNYALNKQSGTPQNDETKQFNDKNQQYQQEIRDLNQKANKIREEILDQPLKTTPSKTVRQKIRDTALEESKTISSDHRRLWTRVILQDEKSQGDLVVGQWNLLSPDGCKFDGYHADPVLEALDNRQQENDRHPAVKARFRRNVKALIEDIKSENGPCIFSLQEAHPDLLPILREELQTAELTHWKISANSQGKDRRNGAIFTLYDSDKLEVQKKSPLSALGKTATGDIYANLKRMHALRFNVKDTALSIVHINAWLISHATPTISEQTIDAVAAALEKEDVLWSGDLNTASLQPATKQIMTNCTTQGTRWVHDAPDGFLFKPSNTKRTYVLLMNACDQGQFEKPHNHRDYYRSVMKYPLIGEKPNAVVAAIQKLIDQAYPNHGYTVRVAQALTSTQQRIAFEKEGPLRVGGALGQRLKKISSDDVETYYSLRDDEAHVHIFELDKLQEAGLYATINTIIVNQAYRTRTTTNALAVTLLGMMSSAASLTAIFFGLVKTALITNGLCAVIFGTGAAAALLNPIVPVALTIMGLLCTLMFICERYALMRRIAPNMQVQLANRWGIGLRTITTTLGTAGGIIVVSLILGSVANPTTLMLVGLVTAAVLAGLACIAVSYLFGFEMTKAYAPRISNEPPATISASTSTLFKESTPAHPSNSPDSPTSRENRSR